MFKSIKMSVSGVSIVVKPTYELSPNTYDLRAEGTNLLTRGVLKKLNVLFNGGDDNISNVFEIAWDESVIKDVQGYNYQNKRVTPVVHDNEDVIGYIEHYFFDNKDYIKFKLSQDICCSMLNELATILKEYSNEFMKVFSEHKRFRNPSAKLDNKKLSRGLKFKFKRARFDVLKGLKDVTNTVKICKKETFTITDLKFMSSEVAIATVVDAEKDQNIVNNGLYYVIKITDSNGYEYDLSSKSYNGCYAFFTNSEKSFKKYVDILR